MKPQLKILSGLGKGSTFVYSRSEILIGRHPGSHLRFDPEHELDVSARHAVVFRKGDRWYVRDGGSRNGTLVNGHAITAETKLDDTDQIRFGQHGPVIEFRLVPDGTPDTVIAPATAERPVRESVASAPAPAPAAAPTMPRGPDRPRPQAPGPVAARAGGSTTQRIRVEVGRQTRTLRAVVGGLLGALVVVSGFFVYESYTQRREREREAAAMQAQVDSIVQVAEAAIQSLKGQVEGLATALRQSQTDVESLRRELATAQAAGNTTQVADLRRRLDSATQTLGYQQAAAQVDYAALWDAHQDAVALIYVEFGPGQVFTGTAFAVSRTGVMITNRHVVAGADGNRRATRIAVRFADSDQVFPGRLLTVSRDFDLAVLKVDITGGTPTIGNLDPSVTARPGDPVAIIGFPLGAELPMSQRGGRVVPKTSFTAGTVSKVLEDRIQLDGYGAEGSSGSPILDRNGRLVGVLFGGQAGTGGRIVFAVPASAAARLAAPYLN